MLIAVLLFIFVYLHGSWSVPADPTPREYYQPDGSRVILKKWGDERINGYETLQGFTVVKNSKGYWVYAKRDLSGKLIPTDITADLLPPENLPKNIKPLSSNTAQKAYFYSGIQRIAPSTGSGAVILVLINFTDTTPTFTRADFESLIFDINNQWSAKSYFQKVSYGNFDFTGEVVDWVIAQNNHDYYGQNDPNTGRDAKPGSLVYEAAEAVDSQIDFSNYDRDGDCKVDAFAVIHQGTSEASAYGQPTDIWAHRSTLTYMYATGRSDYPGQNGNGEYVTNDTCSSNPSQNVRINDYIIIPELYQTAVIAGIGLFVHEYAHILGLPDLYDIDGSSYGIGNWGAMGTGVWNTNPGGTPGDRPAYLSAWAKAVMRWICPIPLSGSNIVVNFPPASNNPNSVYMLGSGIPGVSGEYYLLENRQKIAGTFDEALPGEGLLIWHIDESIPTNQTECPYDHSDPRCDTEHYKVALEQADNNLDLENKTNTGDAGDPFPGTSNNNTFSDTTFPSAKLYGNTNSGVSVRSISISSGNNIGAYVTANSGVPSVDITPTSVDFGAVILGLLSSESFTVSNQATATGLLRVVSLDFVNPTRVFPFRLSNTGISNPCPTAPFCLFPGESCVQGIDFLPTSYGLQTATIEIINNVSPRQVDVSGFGNNKPSVNSFNISPSSGTTPLTVTFNWNVSDPDTALGDTLTCTIDVNNDGTVEHTVNNCQSSNNSWNYTYSNKGTFTAKFTVIDSHGSSSSTTATITVSNNPPVINSFTAFPSSGTVPFKVTFNWDISDPEGDTLVCKIDVNNDGIWDYTITICDSSKSQKHTYSNSGIFTAVLEINDGMGNSTRKQITVKVSPASGGSGSGASGGGSSGVCSSGGATFNPMQLILMIIVPFTVFLRKVLRKKRK